MASQYTFTTKASQGIKIINRYGNQPDDGARVAIQGIGNGPQTQDGASSPVTSPATVTDATVTTLTTPKSAVQITITAITEPVKISEVSTLDTYYELASGGTITLDIAECYYLYLEGVGGSATVSFYYTMV